VAAGSPSSGEWTIEQASKLWKPMTRAVQHVGVPGYQWQAGVLWDGSLVFGSLFRGAPAIQEELAPLGDNLLHLSVAYGDPMRFLDRRGRGSPDIRRRLEDGRLPIPHIETSDGDLLWQETVFAHLLGRRLKEGMRPRPDDMLAVHVLFKVRNAAGSPRPAHLWLHFGDTSQVTFFYKTAVGENLGKELAHRFQPPFGLLGGKVRYLIPGPTKGQLRWHDELPAPPDVQSPPKRVIEWSAPLAPGEEAELRLLLPYGPISMSKAKKLAALDTRAKFAEVCRFWRALLKGTSVITTPDDFLNDYLAAVAGQMAQQVAYRHKANLWMLKTSPNNYETYWPCNAGMALPTLDLRGLTYLSEPVLKSFIEFQTDDVGGLTRTHAGKGELLVAEGYEKRRGFIGNFGGWTANPLLISHGLAMWSLASHYRITRDQAWLGSGPGSPLQAMLDAFDWAAAQRRRTMREENGQRVPHWGLLPAASAHDWLAGNTIFNDAFVIYGMTEIVHLLREIGHPRAEEMAKELNDYRRCLHDRYTEARDRARRLPLPNGGEIPFVPRMTNELDWAKVDWTYTGYGPLRAGAFGVLDPNDELIDQTLAFLAAGLPRGEGFYFAPGSGFMYPDTADANWLEVSDPGAARHFLWRHYVEYETMWPVGYRLFLARDDLDRFFEWFAHNFAAVLHHDWRVGVESLDGAPSISPGEAERWRAVRNMFVNERGGYDGSEQSLWLLQAMPREWLKPGSHLSARKMRTYFGGPLDLDLRVAKSGRALRVAASWDLAELPAEIRIRLRSGDGRPLLAAQVNGASVPVLPGDLIALPLEKKARCQIVGRFR
jgi:hypothetical protein